MTKRILPMLKSCAADIQNLLIRSDNVLGR